MAMLRRAATGARGRRQRHRLQLKDQCESGGGGGVVVADGRGGERSCCLELAKLEDGVRKEQRSNFLEIGKLLTEILDGGLYALRGYKSFVKYVDDEPLFRFTGKHAIRLVRTYRFIDSLPAGANVPTSERQVRPLIKLGFEDARDVWLEAQRRARDDGKPVTGELVAELVGRLNSSRVSGGHQELKERIQRLPHVKQRQLVDCAAHADNEEVEEDREGFNGGGDGNGGTDDDEGADGGDFDGQIGGRGGDWVVKGQGNGDGTTQAAVLLLAEFERLRERVKELPQQQRERLLLEWNEALDKDLGIIQANNGLQQWEHGCRKRRMLVVSGSRSPKPSCSVNHNEESSFRFTIRKKRSRTYKVKRIWRVPSNLHIPGMRSLLADNVGSNTRTSPPAIGCSDFVYKSEGEAVEAKAPGEVAHLGSCGHERTPQGEEEGLVFRCPFVPISAK